MQKEDKQTKRNTTRGYEEVCTKAQKRKRKD